MRSVSFHPWGSLRADGNRRTSALQAIIPKLWSLDPLAPGRPFVASGGVLWTPVIIRGGKVNTPDKFIREDGIVLTKDGDSVGWIASRQPPLHRDKYKAMGQRFPLDVDVTHELFKSQQEGDATYEMLYDCRFLVRFDCARIPKDLLASIKRGDGRVLILPNTRWFWPKIMWRKRYMEDVLLHSVVPDPVSFARTEGPAHKPWVSQNAEIYSDWITIELARTLSAI